MGTLTCRTGNTTSVALKMYMVIIIAAKLPSSNKPLSHPIERAPTQITVGNGNHGSVNQVNAPIRPIQVQQMASKTIHAVFSVGG